MVITPDQVCQQNEDLSFCLVRHSGSIASVNARAVTSATGLRFQVISKLNCDYSLIETDSGEFCL